MRIFPALVLFLMIGCSGSSHKVVPVSWLFDIEHKLNGKNIKVVGFVGVEKANGIILLYPTKQEALEVGPINNIFIDLSVEYMHKEDSVRSEEGKFCQFSGTVWYKDGEHFVVLQQSKLIQCKEEVDA